MLKKTVLILFAAVVPWSVSAQDRSPDVLVVTAHPDDEVMFAATMYRITHALGGHVDLALVTDGAGGYRFSTLGNTIYGLDLTDPDVARTHLPAIRKQELMAGGAIAGLRNYFFLDQPDQGRTEDQDSIMAYVWDREFVADRLDHILAKGNYDFVFTHLPIKPFHSHHKAATILALEAVARMPEGDRPVVLGSFTTGMMDDEVAAFRGLEGHPLTIPYPEGPFVFDRSTPFGQDDRLNYNIIANWMIAEHKSQGTMQLLVSSEGVERFWVFEMNGREGIARTERLMEAVQTAPF